MKLNPQVRGVFFQVQQESKKSGALPPPAPMCCSGKAPGAVELLHPHRPLLLPPALVFLLELPQV